jgi:Rrf2 family protein
VRLALYSPGDWLALLLGGFVKLSKTSAQAALAMAFLSSQTTGELVQARTVGEYLSIPTDSALKILQSLARRGLIISQLGRSGGYRLHRPPEQVSLLEIVEAIEGPISADIRLTVADPALTAGVELLQHICDDAAAYARQKLRSVKLSDLASAGHITAAMG